MENQINNNSKFDPFVIVNQKEQMTSIPAQPTLPPVPEQPQPTAPVLQPQYQQPQPQGVQYVFNLPPVFETDNIDNGNEFDRETLICDDENEHIVLIITKRKEKSKHTESPDMRFGVCVNNRHSIKRNTVAKILSTGCVKLIRVYCPTDERGNKSPLQCEVEIIYREQIRRISLPVDAIRRKDKSVLNALANEGVTFIDNGFKIWCEKFSEQLSKAKVHIEHIGFYKDNNDRGCHVNAEDIALHAVDSQGILKRLGIDFSTDADDVFCRLTLFLHGVGRRIFTVIRSMNVFPMAKLAIVYPERSAALENLKALYCTDSNPPLYPGKLFEKQIIDLRDVVALISLSDTDYMNRQCQVILSRRGSELTTLPFLLSEKEEGFSERNDVLRLCYNLTGIGDISGELCWAVRVLLTEPKLTETLSEKFNYFCTLVKEDTETVGMQKLIALLLSLADAYLPYLGVPTDSRHAILRKYRDYLIDSAYSSSDVVVKRLKTFMLSWRDVPLKRYNKAVDLDENTIISKDDLLLLPNRIFGYTAERCGTTKATFVNILKEEGILQSNGGGNMKNIHLSKGTKRMYALDCSVLFDAGELRPMCANNHAPKPLYQIPIGTADNYNIYFDVYPYDGMRNNPFALITGATGTGKSTLCKTLAINAAMLNLSVVSIGVETSALDLDCNIFEPEEGMEVSVDLFFETLCIDLDEGQTAIADTALELMLEQDYSSYGEILTIFTGLVDNEESTGSLLTAAREAADKLSDFSWDKAIIDGKISQVIAQTPEEADKLLSDFFDYKAAHKTEKRYTLLLLDEVQAFSWNSKSSLVAKILRQGRKFGIVGVFSTQYLNADNGKNIASALKQIGTHFVFCPSDDIAALKQLGYKSSDDEARDVLNFLNTGEALASGNISTDECPLDYPVKFTVNQDDLNDIL